MEGLIKFLYKYLPKKFIQIAGSSAILRPMRNFFLRRDGVAVITTVLVHWKHANLDFSFEANFKTAVIAREKGMENTMLRASLSLLDYKNRQIDKTIVDVGSNYGFLSIVWAKTVCNAGKVYAFEASPTVFKSLSNNIERNGLSSIIVPINRPVYHSTTSVEVQNSTSSSHILKGTENAVFVESISIDDFVRARNIGKIDLLKIDIDGEDFEVLRGAENSIRSFRPIIIVETNQDVRIVELMASSGYLLYDLMMNRLREGQIPGNLICVPT